MSSTPNRKRPIRRRNNQGQQAAAQLNPSDFVFQSPTEEEVRSYSHADFIATATRQYQDGTFNPERWRPTEAYLKSVRERSYLEMVDEDEEIEQERAAALAAATKPLAAMPAIKSLHEAFLERQKNRLPTTPSHNSEASNEPRVIFGVTGNPDFFTDLGRYDGGEVPEPRHAFPRVPTHAEGLDEPGEGDDILYNDEAEAAPPQVATAAAAAVVEQPDDNRVKFDELTVLQARGLLNVNPLAILRMANRASLLQLPDVRSVYQLLNPIVMQHEQHRRHFNIVELVREMNLCGCKYDGCEQAVVEQPLGKLVDGVFYRSFLDENERLRGGHEHFDSNNTQLCILKFYLVHRNAANCQVLQIVDENGRREQRSGPPEDSMRLNRIGLYDIDPDAADRDLYENDAYSSMHNIKHLYAEFMLCLRVVCVEVRPPPPPEVSQVDVDESDTESCVSVLDDDFVVPAPFASSSTTHTTAADEASTSWTIQGGAVPVPMNSASSGPLAQALSAARITAESAVQPRQPMPAPAPQIVVEDGPREEDDDCETKLALEAGHAVPDERVVLTLEQATRLVGAHKANKFLQRVNSNSVGLLCIRAFMFYANALRGE